MTFKPYSGSLHIIGGRWRGQKLRPADSEGLRPTPGRVRETLFNWLRPYITGSRCLDLFAGSGALGFEAMSEGAAQLTMVDINAKVVSSLRQSRQLLQADHCQIKHSAATTFLKSNTDEFDIIFLDPPYHANIWTETAHQLVDTHTLSHHARIYIECPARSGLPSLPDTWQLIRDNKAGNIRYSLFIYTKETA